MWRSRPTGRTTTAPRFWSRPSRRRGRVWIPTRCTWSRRGRSSAGSRRTDPQRPARRGRASRGLDFLARVDRAVDRRAGRRDASPDPRRRPGGVRAPGYVPQDPADQILVAAARVHGLTLVTGDDRVLKYRDVRTVDAPR